VNKKSLAIAWFVSLVCFAAVATGCKQGIGERCQVNHDCASGVCSMSSPRVCVTPDTNENQIDASLPIDAAVDATAATGN
jgi:hypothetical protein